MPPLVVAAVAAGAAVAGGVAGAIERSDASNDAKALMKKRLAELESVGMPPDTSLPIILQEFKSQGIITPQLEQQIHAQASKTAQIKEDPQYKQAQNQALQFLQQKSATGLGPEEKAAFNTLRTQVAKESEGKRQQILQNMAARGMSGSGAELAAQLSASQAGDEALSAGGDKLAAEASRNALAAISQSGDLAGKIRGQDFDVASAKARAEDELNRFNTQSDISRQTRNVSGLNDAQIRNLQEKQRLADTNTGMANQEAQRQMAEKANVWRNKLAYSNAKGGIYGEQADQRLKEGAAAAQGWQQMGVGVAQGVAGIGGGIGKSAVAPVAGSSAGNLGVDTSLSAQSADLNSLSDKYPWLKK